MVMSMIEIEPLEAGKGFEFENKIVGGTYSEGIYSCC